MGAPCVYVKRPAGRTYSTAKTLPRPFDAMATRRVNILRHLGRDGSVPPRGILALEASMFRPLFALLSIAALCAGSLVVTGCEPAKIELPDPGKNAVTITVQSTPPGATISVDGIPVGPAPQTVKVRPGPHTFKAMQSGYFSAEQRIVASSDTPKDLALTLVASH